MNERESPPFPFLPGMIVRLKTESGYTYYKTVGQAQQTVLTAPYALGPNQSNTGLSFNIGNVNAFQTSSSLLKQWVTWVDNPNLGVQWTINGRTLPLLNGSPQYLTKQNSPKYDYSIQFYSVASLNIQANYNLVNLNSLKPIRGVLTVIVATSTVEPISGPIGNSPVTDITIGGTSVVGV